jgi:hypothetical protein
VVRRFDAMTTARSEMKAPVEELMLHAAQDLTESAYERFSQGELSSVQLKQFYEVVRDWSKASEEVLETMQRLGIQT